MPKCLCCVKRPRCDVAAEVERNIVLGIDLIALKSIATSNRAFGRIVRDSFNIDGAHAARCMLVARRYGDWRQITDRLSWATLVELSAPSTPEPVRHELEARILAGAIVLPRDVRRARRLMPSDQTPPRTAA
jgi:hypothetical protein